MLVAVGVDLADRLPGGAERLRGARHRAGHRRAAAVRLLRREQPARDARRRWACCSTSPAAARRTCARCAARARKTRRSENARTSADRDRSRRDRRARGARARRSRTRCGSGGLRSSSSAATAPSARSCPPPATRFERARGLGARPPQPAARGCARCGSPRARCVRARAAARGRAHRRRAGRRRLRRRAGRAGRADAAHPDRADRGRQPPRADQPRARAARRARLPRLSDRRAAPAAATASPGRPVAPPTADRDAARAAFGIEPWRAVRARVRRLARVADDQRGGARGPRRRATSACCTSPARATGRRCAARPRGPLYDLREYLDRDAVRRRRWRPATSSSARAGGSIFEIAAYGRPAILVPFPARERRPPAHQRASGWSAPGPRSSSPTPS